MLEIGSLVRLLVCFAQAPRPFFEGNCNPYCNRTSLDYFIQILRPFIESNCNLYYDRPLLDCFAQVLRLFVQAAAIFTVNALSVVTRYLYFVPKRVCCPTYLGQEDGMKRKTKDNVNGSGSHQQKC